MRQAITCGDGLSAEIRCRVFLPPLATRAADRRVRESGVDQETDGFHGVGVVKWSPEEVTVKREWREGGENSRDGSDAKLLGVLRRAHQTYKKTFRAGFVRRVIATQS